MPPRRLRGLDVAVSDAFEKLAQDPTRPGAAIHQDLEDRFGKKRAPSLRAIQRDLKARRLKDDSAPWSLADASPEDVAIVLPVLAEFIRVNEGRRKYVTLDEVKWIKKIRAAVPELHPWDVYTRTFLYRRAVERDDQEQLRYLDAELAIRPWESPEQAEVWARAFGMTTKGPSVWITTSAHWIPRHAQEAPKSAGEVRRGKKTKR